LLELVVVVAIVGVLLAISAPSFQTSLKSAHLSAATSSVTAAIQSTRFNAIVSGCNYQVAFSQSTTTYVITAQKLSGNPPACATTYTSVGSGSPISWSGSGDISLKASTTLTFLPNGVVNLYSGGSTPCTTGLACLVLSNGTVATNTIIVSGVGNVKVTSP
jgi:type IV fimbrial biogenesis protein FimT